VTDLKPVAIRTPSDPFQPARDRDGRDDGRKGHRCAGRRSPTGTLVGQSASATTECPSSQTVEVRDRDRWKSDEAALSQLGAHLFGETRRVEVRLPAALAQQAEAAWLREDLEEREDETPAIALTRARAGTWALIGLAVHERGRRTGEEVLVELDAWEIGRALDAAEEHGLLTR